MLPIDVRVLTPIKIKQGSILTLEDKILKSIDQQNPYDFFKKNCDPLMFPPENKEESEENIENINALQNEETIPYESKSQISRNWSKAKTIFSRKAFGNKVESQKKFNQPFKLKAGTSFIELDSIKSEENYNSNKFNKDDIIRFGNRKNFQFAKVVGSCLLNGICCLKILVVYPIDLMVSDNQIIQEDNAIRIFDKEIDIIYYENVIMNPNPLLKVEEIENEKFKINDSIKFSLMFTLNNFYGIIKWIGKINDIPIAIVNMEIDIMSESEKDYKIDENCSINFENLKYEDDQQLFIIPICFLMKAELQKNNVIKSDLTISERNTMETKFICMKNVILKKDDICEFSSESLSRFNNQDISSRNALLSNCRKLSETDYDLVSKVKRKNRIKKLPTFDAEQQKPQEKKSIKRRIRKSKSCRENLKKLKDVFLLISNNLENFEFDFSETEFRNGEQLIITCEQNEFKGKFYCSAKYETEDYICMEFVEKLVILKKNISSIIFRNNKFLNDFEGVIVKKEAVRKVEQNPNSIFKRNEIVKYIDNDNISYARVIDPILNEGIPSVHCSWHYPKKDGFPIFKESEIQKIADMKHEMKYYQGTIMKPYPVLAVEMMKMNFNIGDGVEFNFKYSLTELSGLIEWTGKLNEIPCAVIDLNILTDEEIISEIGIDYKIDKKCSINFENLKYEDVKQLFLIPICFLKVEQEKNKVKNSNTFSEIPEITNIDARCSDILSQSIIEN